MKIMGHFTADVEPDGTVTVSFVPVHGAEVPVPIVTGITEGESGYHFPVDVGDFMADMLQLQTELPDVEEVETWKEGRR